MDKKTAEKILGLHGKYGKYEVNKAFRKKMLKMNRLSVEQRVTNFGEAELAVDARNYLLEYTDYYHIVQCEMRTPVSDFLDKLVRGGKTKKDMVIPKGPSVRGKHVRRF